MILQDVLDDADVLYDNIMFYTTQLVRSCAAYCCFTQYTLSLSLSLSLSVCPTRATSLELYHSRHLNDISFEVPLPSLSPLKTNMESENGDCEKESSPLGHPF